VEYPKDMLILGSEPQILVFAFFMKSYPLSQCLVSQKLRSAQNVETTHSNASLPPNTMWFTLILSFLGLFSCLQEEWSHFSSPAWALCSPGQSFLLHFTSSFLN
jgi:hypothetical protein